MRIVFEEYRYPQDIIRDILWEGAFKDIKGFVTIHYVGYYYNPRIQDCVFILPKVLLEEKIDDNGKKYEVVFGNIRPEELLNINFQTQRDDIPVDFLYQFSVWIHRAITVYAQLNQDNNIVLHDKQVSTVGNGRVKLSNTYLDIILSLIQFNKDNRDFLLFTLKNLHSGCNKINWTRTIAHSQGFIQGGRPIYINPVNKKRQINFDEELLVIYYSILNFIHQSYGFPVDINVGYDLITGAKFSNYLRGYGCRKMRQLKYKYFSDRTLALWELCNTFFEKAHQIRIKSRNEEYLLVKSFNIVFEAMIDELIGDTRASIPAGLKDQDDGKRVDHMYRYRNLTNNEDKEHEVFYIGDSKYYKRGESHNLQREAVYKQYTYAKNVIQWNLNLFMNEDDEDIKKDIDRFLRGGHEQVRKLRDDITEGYDIIPNFFISAMVNSELNYQEHLKLTERSKQTYQSRQFENRLFDRDTLLMAHYDVNFLHIVSLYARNNQQQKRDWKIKVRKAFRKAIQDMLTERYDFYAMTPHQGVSAVAYLEEHFKELLGKVYTPYADRNLQKYYSLALSKDKAYEDENSVILAQLKQAFYVKPCPIGTNPYDILEKIEPVVASMDVVVEKKHTLHYLENYHDDQVLIGCYKDEPHWNWINGVNDKGTTIYNVRLGKKVEGGQLRSKLEEMTVRFVILYKDGDNSGKYHVYRVHHHAIMTKKRMHEAWYPTPIEEMHAEKYFCYVMDEEVSIGNIDLMAIIKDNQPIGSPIYKSCDELIKYRK